MNKKCMINLLGVLLATVVPSAVAVGVEWTNETEFSADSDQIELACGGKLCPDDAIPEGEPECGTDYLDEFNGGCNISPNRFISIKSGDTICGTSGTYSYFGESFRDTDWYEVVLEEPSTITVSFAANFFVRVGMLEQYVLGKKGCDNLTLAFDPSYITFDCVPQTFSTQCLPSGTYYFWVGPESGWQIACDSGQYYLSVTTTPCEYLEGETCENAIVIPELPAAVSGDTEAYDHNVEFSCDFSETNAPDVVYSYTAPRDMSISVDACLTHYDPKIALLEGSCDGSVVACSNDNGVCLVGSQARLDADLTAGVTYYLVIDGEYENPNDDPFGEYFVSITEIDPNAFACSGTPEGEPGCGDGYIDAFNAGCSSDSPVFSSLSCGETVCGTAGVYLSDGVRVSDIDWYEVTVTDRSALRYTFTSNGYSRLLVFTQNVKGQPGCGNISSYYWRESVGGVPITIDSRVIADPGVYYVAVVPYYIDVVNIPYFWSTCQSGKYSLTVDCLPICDEPICPPDAKAEGEPDCGPGYVDSHNAGCNYPLNRFIRINPGETVCGTSGTWTDSGDAYRDTDWYRLDLPEPARVTVEAQADFSAIVAFLDQEVRGVAGCDNLTGFISSDYITTQSGQCGVRSMTTESVLPAGAYYLFVAPVSYDDPPCGEAHYNLTVDAIEYSSCDIVRPIGRGMTAGSTRQTPTWNVATCSISDTYDYWYEFTACQDGLLEVSTCGSETEFDAGLSIWTDCPGNGGIELDCSDDYCLLQAEVSADLVAGQTVLVRVTGHRSEFGEFEIDLMFPDCNLPSDLNGDGVVDLLDAAILQKSFGFTSAGDLNGDVVTDFTDLTLLLAEMDI